MTRAAGASDRTGALLAARGFVPVLAPLIAVRPAVLAWPAGATPQAVLVTSGHALASLASLASVALPLLAVGDATAARARAAGWTRVLSADGDARDLAALCRATCRPDAGPLLLASGAGQGAPLAADLRASGFRVHRRIAYRPSSATAFPDAAAAAIGAGLAAALFLSRGAAVPFARLLPPEAAALLASAIAIGISDAAIDPVRRLPWRGVRVAVRPTLEDVLALL